MNIPIIKKNSSTELILIQVVDIKHELPDTLHRSKTDNSALTGERSRSHDAMDSVF